jgi:hypothetical protein
MRSLMLVMCASLPLMFGATNFTVNNADLVLVSGPGPVQVVTGTVSLMGEPARPFTAKAASGGRRPTARRLCWGPQPPCDPLFRQPRPVPLPIHATQSMACMRETTTAGDSL